MSNDLISREAAIKMLREKAQGYVVSMFATMTECNIAKIVAMECANELNGLPAVDAETVRHGKWIVVEDEYGDYARCSVCGDEFICWEGDCAITNYCPNCGAKMDLEDDE